MRYYRLIKNLSNWWLHIAVKMGASKADPMVFKTRSGLVVEVPRRLKHEFKEIFMEDAYLTGLENELQENPIIVDIGANAGFFTIFAASVFKGARVLAYEPIPSNFAQLKRNKDVNPDADITVFNEAVSGSTGFITLAYDPEDSFTTSASIIERNDGQDGRIEVPSIDITGLFEKMGIEKCDLIKIDCEGAEYEILYSCPDDTLNKIDQAAIEVHRGTEKGQDMESLKAYMESKGFKTRACDNMLWTWR